MDETPVLGELIKAQKRLGSPISAADKGWLHECLVDGWEFEEYVWPMLEWAYKRQV